MASAVLRIGKIIDLCFLFLISRFSWDAVCSIWKKSWGTLFPVNGTVFFNTWSKLSGLYVFECKFKNQFIESTTWFK